MAVELSAESLDWFRATYGAEYDGEKFEKIAFWLQRQQRGRIFKTGSNLVWLKYYYDLTNHIPDFKSIVFSDDDTRIKIE